jgi:hypothetical protein
MIVAVTSGVAEKRFLEFRFTQGFGISTQKVEGFTQFSFKCCWVSVNSEVAFPELSDSF